jgi:tetratricopeptide (TPR) repeat protein
VKTISSRSFLLGLVLFACFAPAWAKQTESLQQYLQAAAKAYQAGELNTATQYYQAAIELDPKSAAAYQGLGNCYYRLANVPEALKAFDRSLALNPNNPKLAAFARGLRADAGPSTEMASDTDKEEIDKDLDDIETEMFRPNWTEQLGLSRSGQPSQTGQGQVQSELDFTGTDHLTEGGDYFSAGGGLGSQKVEKAATGYGKATVEGGLVLGFFQPSLNFQFERGQTALNSNALTANLNFQVLDSLILGMSFSGTLESHDGPASLVGATAVTLAETTVEIDDRNGSASVMAEYNPWDFLGFTLTGEQEDDNTYQAQGLRHLKTVSLNESDQINSISLMADLTFLHDFELQLMGQTGVENLPAGTVYSPIQAETITLTQPTTEPFKGYTFALLYNFK